MDRLHADDRHLSHWTDCFMPVVLTEPMLLRSALL